MQSVRGEVSCYRYATLLPSPYAYGTLLGVADHRATC